MGLMILIHQELINTQKLQEMGGALEMLTSQLVEMALSLQLQGLVSREKETMEI